MADEFRKAEAQFLRMQAKGRHTNMEIQSIDIVRNRRLQQKFEAKKAQLAAKEGSDVKSLLLFHGTPQQNVPSILRDNFDLSKVVNGRAHGNGVYFSEQPEVSLGYSMTPANRPYPPGHVSFWPFSQSGLPGITFPGITFQQVQSATWVPGCWVRSRISSLNVALAFADHLPAEGKDESLIFLGQFS